MTGSGDGPGGASGVRRRESIAGAARQVSAGRTFLWAFVALFTVGCGWCLAVPYDGFADEARHTVRAWSAAGGALVFHGPVQGDGTPLITAPKSLAPNAPANSACFQQHPQISAACSPPAGLRSDGRRMVTIATGAGRYNPLYYAIVGQPLRLWPDNRGIYLARTLSDAMVSALFAAAFAVTASAARGRRLLSGLLVALTPVALNLSAAINPAGLEIAGAVLLWSALVLLVDGRMTSPWLVRACGVGAAVLAVVRAGGLAWLALILLVGALGLSRRHARRLAREGAVRRWAALVALAVVAGAGWNAWQNPTGQALTLQPGQSRWNLVANALNIDVWGRGEYLVDGVVGLVGFGDTSPPGLVFPVWFCAFGVVLFGAVALTRRRDRIRLLLPIAGTAALSLAVDVGPISQGWYLSQGRYALPVLAGVPILGAYLLAERGVLDDSSLARLARCYVVVLLPLQLLTLYAAMLRYQRGLQPADPIPVMPVNPFKGAWLPPLGPQLPLALAAAGLAALGVLVWRTAGRPGPLRGPGDAGDQVEPAGFQLLRAASTDGQQMVDQAGIE
ncbi:DUF2142 domain-containing protein [Streptacidiphilus rugosus]|uniref:DUF2142 domain-containing protein n=1 Tax=Streptacidiphilus rugosus TaxID=405783 RepID=UPI000AE71E2B|nr:DUF2142 domain-containing protein [Streptacidiphilus rugosus]